MYKDDIIRLNQEGKYNDEIVKETGASLNYIKFIISKNGLKSNTKKSRVIDLYKQGYSLDDICKMANVSKATAKGYVTQANIARRGKNYDKQIYYEQMRKLYLEDRKSIEEISQEIGFAPSTIHSRLSIMGCLTERIKLEEKEAKERERQRIEQLKQEKENQRIQAELERKQKEQEEKQALEELEKKKLREEEKKKEAEKIRKEIKRKREEKPYEELDNDIVLYNGRMYKKLTTDELRYYLRRDLTFIVTTKRGRKKTIRKGKEI